MELHGRPLAIDLCSLVSMAGGAGEGNRAGLRFIFLSSLWFCEKQEGAEGHIGCLC